MAVISHGLPSVHEGAFAAVTVVGTVAVAAVGAASADRASVATPTTVEATTPAAASITNGPLTVTLVDAHYSDAASQLVVVLELTAATTLEPQAAGAVYVGPDGQQVEATDYIEPERVFVDATALSVMVFPAASPGGTVMYYALADTTRLDVSIPVMIAELAEPIGTETVPEDPPPVAGQPRADCGPAQPRPAGHRDERCPGRRCRRRRAVGPRRGVLLRCEQPRQRR